LIITFENSVQPSSYLAYLANNIRIGILAPLVSLFKTLLVRKKIKTARRTNLISVYVFFHHSKKTTKKKLLFLRNDDFNSFR